MVNDDGNTELTARNYKGGDTQSGHLQCTTGRLGIGCKYVDIVMAIALARDIWTCQWK